MRNVYRVLAYLIALDVALQASFIAFAVFGLSKFVEDGNTITPDMVGENAANPAEFTGVEGFGLHAMNGFMVIPLLALVLLIVAAFAKVKGGVWTAGVVLVLVLLQVILGGLSHGTPGLGLLHGLNALAIFGTALFGGHLARSGATAPAAA